MNYPPELNIEAWHEWLAYRKETKLKAYKKTERGELAAAKHLIELAGSYEAQIDVVQQSINNQWQGLFELKGQAKVKSDERVKKQNVGEEPLLFCCQNTQDLVNKYGDGRKLKVI